MRIWERRRKNKWRKEDDDGRMIVVGDRLNIEDKGREWKIFTKIILWFDIVFYRCYCI